MFLAHKDETFLVFTKFHRKVSNKKGTSIISIRSDHGTEFENHEFDEFCNEHGINHNFSAPRTPQQNGVVERKNRTLEEMTCTMLCENDLPRYFWAEAINTSCYILNRVLIRPILKKTPYELWKNRKPTIKYFHIFGCRCFILNNGKDNLSKFDAKSDEGIFLGYSTSSKAYRVFNKRTLVVEESMHIVFDESNEKSSRIEDACDDDAGASKMKELTINEENAKDDQEKEDREELPSTRPSDLPKEWRYVHGHPKELIIGDPSKGVRTRSSIRNICDYLAFVSQVEPKSIEEAEKDSNRINVM